MAVESPSAARAFLILITASLIATTTQSLFGLHVGPAEVKSVSPSKFNDSLDNPEWIDRWEGPAQLREWLPYYVAGHDEEGSPVFVYEYGNWKFAQALRNGPGGPANMKPIIMRYINQAALHFVRAGEANGGQGAGSIIDFNGFSLANLADPMAIELALRLFGQLGRTYAVLNDCFFINSNFAAENFLRIAKPFMGNILEKCEVFGTYRAKWLPAILRKIPKDQLPPWYGGEPDNHWRPVWIGGTAFTSSTPSGQA